MNRNSSFIRRFKVTGQFAHKPTRCQSSCQLVNSRTSQGVVCGFNPNPQNLQKNLSVLLSQSFHCNILPQKPMMMYSVSYFCTRMHHFKAKIFPTATRGHSFVRPTPSQYWTLPQMKFLATALNYMWKFDGMGVPVVCDHLLAISCLRRHRFCVINCNVERRRCLLILCVVSILQTTRHACVTPGFQHYVAVPVSVPVSFSVAVFIAISVTVSVTVSVKTVSVPAVPYVVAGACARQ